MVHLYSNEAEKSLLGALIADSSKLTDIVDMIGPEDFYHRGHGIIFDMIRRLFDGNMPVDIITLPEALDSDNKLGIIHPEGAEYLVGLACDIPTTQNVLAYAKIIRDKSTERKVFKVGEQITCIAYSTTSTEEKVLAAQEKVMALESHTGEDAAIAGTILRDVIEDIEKGCSDGNELRGLSTGLTALDKRLGGLRKSELIVLASRPSMGKTTLAMNIAQHVASVGQKSVLIFSLEMSMQNIFERMISHSSGVPYKRIRDRKLDDDDWEKIIVASKRIKKLPLYIDASPSLSINQMLSRANRRHSKTGLGLVVVDYLQLAIADGNNREREIAKISQGLKKMAKDLDVPVIVVSQLNRECEKNDDKRPNNSHLRDSGSIEQDADVILFIYRDVMYRANAQNPSLTELICTKYRNGETGTDHLKSRLDVCRFEDWPHLIEKVQEKKKSVFPY